ncbi:MAG: hypothetical protein ACPGGN_00135 [Opitutales bacterium]
MSEQSHLLYALSIWYQPSRTIQGLVGSGCGHRLAILVAAIFGFIQAIPFYLSEDSAGSEMFLIGVGFGLLGLFLFAWLLRNFGRWFGAQAAVRDVRVALGLSLMPWLALFGVLFWMRQSFGPEVLQSYYWLFFVGFVYGYVVILMSLSAALRLSVLKTFFCLIVTCMVSLFPLTLMLQLLFPTLMPVQ